MRCKSCDNPLTDREATRKSRVTNEYLDMCNGCLGEILPDIPNTFQKDDDLWDKLDQQLEDLED